MRLSASMEGECMQPAIPVAHMFCRAVVEMTAALRKPPVIAQLQTHVYGVVPPAQSENPAIVAALPS